MDVVRSVTKALERDIFRLAGCQPWHDVVDTSGDQPVSCLRRWKEKTDGKNETNKFRLFERRSGLPL